MEKDTIRQEIWDELEERGEARFPFPPHGRIPNFAGASEAARRVEELDIWTQANVVKANPDAPQLPVRRAALRQGKTVYMAVPRLSEEKCFLRLDPDRIDDIDNATTVGGSAEEGEPVHPRDMDSIDLIVSGSVAVTENGARIGKGEGYSDLEFAILTEFDLVTAETAVITTVHESQVVDVAIETGAHDVPLDHVLTPDRHIETNASEERPAGLRADLVEDHQIDSIPIVSDLI